MSHWPALDCQKHNASKKTREAMEDSCHDLITKIKLKSPWYELQSYKLQSFGVVGI